MKRIYAGLSAAAALGAGTAWAQQPVDGGVEMLPAASKLAEEVHFFHNIVLMPVITVITILVLGLLVWVMLRFNSRANPTPRKFSHNTLVEIIWTGVPILILVYVALFSFDLLFKEDTVPDGKQVVVMADGEASAFVFRNDFPKSRKVSRPEHVQVFLGSADGERRLAARKDYRLEGLGDPEVKVTLNAAPAPGERVIIRGGRSLVGPSGFMGLGADEREVALAPTVTLKVIGFQWGWTYTYPDFGDFEFTALPLKKEETTPDLYLFETNNHVVVPVGETIRVTTTARDVIHSWALPNYAIKIDAVPGRINETWFKAEREGTYYGQCSEICGIKHAFMPIAVDVVSRPQFEAWVDSQRALAGLEPMFSGDHSKLAQASVE
jgi:cytochrome c oxidase subunit 2